MNGIEKRELPYDVAVTAFINRGIIIHNRILG